MAVYLTEVVTDLAMPPQQRPIPHQFAMGDNNAYTITALLCDSRNPEAELLDGTVGGELVRPDGVTVALAGEKGDAVRQVNLAAGGLCNATPCSVTLPQACFAVPGRVTLTIKLTDGTTITQALSVSAVVVRTSTDEAVDPGNVIPDLADIQAAAAEATAAAADARAAADHAVQYDAAQSLTSTQQEQARDNIGAAAVGVEGAAGYRSELIMSGYDSGNTGSSSGMSAIPFIPNLMLSEVWVTGLRLNVQTAGTLTIGYYPRNGAVVNTAYNSAAYIRARTVSVSGTGDKTVWLDSPVWIPAGYVLAFGDTTDTIVFRYGSNGFNKTFLYVSSGNFKNQTKSLNFDIYAMRDMNLPILNAAVEHESVTLLRGYDAANTEVSNNSTATPFVTDITETVVTGLKIDVAAAGIMDVGLYQGPVQAGEMYDAEKYKPLFYLRATETGVQTFTFAPIGIPSGWYLTFGGYHTSTMTFHYGMNGTDLGFWYHKNTGFTRMAVRTIGMDIYGEKFSFVPGTAIQSVYAGKRLSIFGDSISTFAGWIPEGNAVYYTGSNAGVATVDDTWWMKTIKAMGFELLVNNSWSGRAVSSVSDGTAEYSTCAGYKEANVVQLKSGNVLPEVIIVKLGINDFNRECPLGTYDGSTALPNDPSTFTNAYAMMLDLIMTNFPLAEVWCCTLMAAEKNSPTGFPEINGNGESLSQWNEAIRQLAHAFGAKVLEHGDCGITYYNLSTYMGDWSSSTHQGLHPNASGHSLMANATIHDMDNAVRKRY